MNLKKPLMQLRRVRKDFNIRRLVRLHALSDISLPFTKVKNSE